MKINLVSDLHIDVNRGVFPQLPGGEVLLVAGDLAEICSLNPLGKVTAPSIHRVAMDMLREKAEVYLIKIKEQFTKYDRVISVAGNHEFGGGNFDTTRKFYKDVLPEIELIENQTISLTEYTVLFGATLWTDLDNLNPLVEVGAHSWWDYQNIRVGLNNGRLSTNDTYHAHVETLAKIHQCAEEYSNKDILILTHFLPSIRSCNPRYKMSLDNAFFYSNLDHIIEEHKNIKYWCHGHTHDWYDYKIEQCRVMCNPFGYIVSRESTGFNELFNFEVK